MPDAGLVAEDKIVRETDEISALIEFMVSHRENGSICLPADCFKKYRCPGSTPVAVQCAV